MDGLTAPEGFSEGLTEGFRGAVLEAARAYTRRGWRVVPLEPHAKAPAVPGWQKLRLAEDDLPHRFGPHENVGILLGAASGGLVDVDCDAPEAVVAAALLLPPTGCVHGRAGKPASHYWYVVEGEGEARTVKFAFMDGASGPSAMLVELRATGGQTMAPPSVHPCGEVLRWERSGEPGRVVAGALRRAVAQVAAAALLARHWPGQGTRDEAAVALAGLLLRGGAWNNAAADQFAQAVAQAAGDEEWVRRGKGRQTAAKLAAGEPVTGGPALARLFGGEGARVVAQVRTWLGLGAGADERDARRGSSQPEDAHSPNMSAFGGNEHLRTSWATALQTLDDVALADVEERRVAWLGPGRIPLGALTMLDGDPGLGKSLLTLDLVARVTTGRAMPDGAPGVEGGAVLLSAEDDLAATVRPRLAAASADMRRVRAVRTVRERLPEGPDGDADGSGTALPAGRIRERAFTLPQDIHLLETAMERVGARLVVIDPLMAYLDPRVNSWRDQDVRATLAPLARLAEQTGAAILILRHLNKSSGGNALYRGGGSVGIIGAARSGLLVAKSPDDPEHERILASSKSNLGPPMTSLRYCLSAEHAESESGEPGVPHVEWLGACDYGASALLSQPTDGEAEPTAVEEATAFLRERLAHGPLPAQEVQREAFAAGFSEATLRRAKAKAKGERYKEGPFNASHWLWKLRGEALASPGAAAGSVPSSAHPPEDVEGAHAAIMSTFGPDEHLRAASLACPVTGGAHEYALLRDARGHRLCIECQQVEGGAS